MISSLTYHYLVISRHFSTMNSHFHHHELTISPRKNPTSRPPPPSGRCRSTTAPFQAPAHGPGRRGCSSPNWEVEKPVEYGMFIWDFLIWLCVKTLAPSEHQNSWYMDVHPTKNGIYRYWSIAIWEEINQNNGIGLANDGNTNLETIGFKRLTIIWSNMIWINVVSI